MARPLGELSVSVTADTRQAERQVRSFSDKIQGNVRTITGSLTRAGNQLTIGLTAPIALATKKVISLGAEIEQLAKTAATVSAPDFTDTKAIQRAAVEIEKAAEIVGAATRFSNRDIAESAVVLARAGVDTSKIAEDQGAVLRRIADFASVAGTTITSATEISVRSLGAMGQAVNDTNLERLNDVLSVGANIAPTNMEELALAISYVGPIASTVGFDVEQLTASLSALANAGIRGSRAGTGLARIITSLANPSGPSKELLKELNIELLDSQGNFLKLTDILGQFQGKFADLGTGEQARIANQLFGDRGGPAFLNLLRSLSTGELPRLEATLRDVDGAAGSMADSINDTTLGRLELLTGEIESFSGRLFRDVIRQPFNTIITNLEEAVQAAGRLNTETLKIGLAFTGIAAAIGPLVRITGFFADNLTPLFNLFVTVGPAYVLPLAAAIGSVATVLILAFENSENLRKSFAELGTTFVDFFSNATGGFDPIITAFGEMQKALVPVTTLIGDVLAKGIFALVDAMQSADQTIVNGISSTLEAFPAIITGLVGVIQEAAPDIRNTFENIGEILRTAGDNLPDDFATSIALVISTVITGGAEIASVMSEIARVVAPPLIELLELLLKFANGVIYLSDSFGPLSSVLQAGIGLALLKSIGYWRASSVAMAATGAVATKQIGIFSRLGRAIGNTRADFRKFSTSVKDARIMGGLVAEQQIGNFSSARAASVSNREAQRRLRDAAREVQLQRDLYRLRGASKDVSLIGTGQRAPEAASLKAAEANYRALSAAAAGATAKTGLFRTAMGKLGLAVKGFMASFGPMIAIMAGFYVFDRISTAMREERERINEAGKRIREDVDNIFSGIRSTSDFAQELRFGIEPIIDFNQDVNGIIRNTIEENTGKIAVGVEVEVAAIISDIVFGEAGGGGSFEDRLKNQLIDVQGGQLLEVNVEDLITDVDIQGQLADRIIGNNLEDTIFGDRARFFDYNVEVRTILKDAGVEFNQFGEITGEEQIERAAKALGINRDDFIERFVEVDPNVRKMMENQVKEGFEGTVTGLRDFVNDADPYFQDILQKSGITGAEMGALLAADLDATEMVAELDRINDAVDIAIRKRNDLINMETPRLEGLRTLGEIYKENTTLLDLFNNQLSRFNDLTGLGDALSNAEAFQESFQESGTITNEEGQRVQVAAGQAGAASIAGLGELSSINAFQLQTEGQKEVARRLIEQSALSNKVFEDAVVAFQKNDIDQSEGIQRIVEAQGEAVAGYRLELEAGLIDPEQFEALIADLEGRAAAARLTLRFGVEASGFLDSLNPQEAQAFEQFINAEGDIDKELTALASLQSVWDEDTENLFNKYLPVFAELTGQTLTFGVDGQPTPETQRYLDMLALGLVDLNVRIRMTGTERLAQFGALPEGFVEKIGANGGLFDEPTRMLIGEAGEEALIPLTRPARALSLIKQAGIDRMVINDMIKNGGGAGGMTNVNAPKSVTYAPQYNVHGVEPGQVVAYMKAREEADMARISGL